MSNLKNREELTLDSREMAKMVGKRHSDLLRDIRNYSKYLNESKIALVNFFIVSRYTDGKGEARPNYQVTKKGCEFIAHKLTGQKGTKFIGDLKPKVDFIIIINLLKKVTAI